uniref:Uncharacterized protein n=1 Tax=Anguilla anguilla TaxID=7936 RepID=A0A0E9XPX7_ANGAN
MRVGKKIRHVCISDARIAVISAGTTVNPQIGRAES